MRKSFDRLPALILGLVLPGFAAVSSAAEKTLSFRDKPRDQAPDGFQSLLLGFGKPGEWKVVADEASADSGQNVLAQLAREPLNNRFPVLLDEQVYSDFRLTTKFKIVGGALEQSAGLVFRFQNESNYYVIRADALANTFRCYKVENGMVKPPIGPDVAISRDEWHTLVVQCEGTRILGALDGQDLVKLIDNNARKTGRIGFWTKSDSEVRFGDVHLTFTPYEPLAQSLVRNALQEFPRVLDIAIFAVRTAGAAPVLIAGGKPEESGQPGGKTEADTIELGNTYYGKSKEWVAITMPLRDRNGDPIAAVRVRLKSFPGQTQDNAVVRAQPILKSMQGRVQSLDELLE